MHLVWHEKKDEGFLLYELFFFPPVKETFAVVIFFVVYEQGCALAEPGVPGIYFFPLGWLKNLSFFHTNHMLGTLQVYFTGFKALNSLQFFLENMQPCMKIIQVILPARGSLETFCTFMTQKFFEGDLFYSFFLSAQWFNSSCFTASSHCALHQQEACSCQHTSSSLTCSQKSKDTSKR